MHIVTKNISTNTIGHKQCTMLQQKLCDDHNTEYLYRESHIELRVPSHFLEQNSRVFPDVFQTNLTNIYQDNISLLINLFKVILKAIASIKFIKCVN